MGLGFSIVNHGLMTQPLSRGSIKQFPNVSVNAMEKNKNKVNPGS
jgi:hypothetical protein